MRLCSRCFLYLLRRVVAAVLRIASVDASHQMPFTAGLHTLRACFCFTLLLTLMLVVMTMVATVALLRIAVRHAFPTVCI